MVIIQFFLDAQSSMPPTTYTRATAPKSHAIKGMPIMKRRLRTDDFDTKDTAQRLAKAKNKATAPDQ